METIFSIIGCIIIFFLLLGIAGYCYVMYSVHTIKKKAEKYVNKTVLKKIDEKINKI